MASPINTNGLTVVLSLEPGHLDHVLLLRSIARGQEVGLRLVTCHTCMSADAEKTQVRMCVCVCAAAVCMPSLDTYLTVFPRAGVCIRHFRQHSEPSQHPEGHLKNGASRGRRVLRTRGAHPKSGSHGSACMAPVGTHTLAAGCKPRPRNHERKSRNKHKSKPRRGNHCAIVGPVAQFFWPPLRNFLCVYLALFDPTLHNIATTGHMQ